MYRISRQQLSHCILVRTDMYGRATHAPAQEMSHTLAAQDDPNYISNRNVRRGSPLVNTHGTFRVQLVQ